MFSATAFTIRRATPDDAAALQRLAALDEQEALPAGPVLIGELGGRPAAAVSLGSRRVVANPFAATSALVVHMRMRADAVAAYERTPSLPDRIRAALSGAVLARPAVAS